MNKAVHILFGFFHKVALQVDVPGKASDMPEGERDGQTDRRREDGS